MKTAQLIYNRETDRLSFDGDDLHCGTPLEVLVIDGLDGSTKWVETTLEYSQDWFLTGLLGYQASGLFARM